MTQISGDEAQPEAARRLGSPLAFARDLSARVRNFVGGLDADELFSIVALLALCVLVRLLRLQPIEYYDDEVSRWHFVRQWFHANDFHHAHWTHHMARFGVNVPLFFFLALLGRKASVYYVWPVVAFALQVLFVYLTTKRLGGRAAGVLAAILLSLFSGMDRGASQLLPDGMGGTGTILVCYLLVRYQEATFEQRLRWLVGAALAFFWAYEIKESNLLFLPGTALGVWLCRGRFRDGVLFGAVLFGAIALETAGFRIFTDYSSRFAIVEESHGIATVKSFWNLFDRFTKLEQAWQMLLCSWGLSALWLLGTRDRRSLLLVIMPAAFVLLLTFMVRSTNPIVLWTRFFSRYFEPTAPLLIVAVALFLAEVGRRIWSTHAPAKFSDRLAQLPGQPALLTAFVCLLVGLAEYGTADSTLPNPSLIDARRISRITNDAYRRNLPIVQVHTPRSEPEERRVRSLKAVFGIYLDDRLIATSEGSKQDVLPEVLEAVRSTKRHAYLIHDSRPYQPGQVESLIEAGCAVVVTEEKDYLNAAPKVPSLVLQTPEKLPARCKAPES
jgi:Dolichyl-phosphate-mannose-protein mannosyltransferase